MRYEKTFAVVSTAFDRLIWTDIHCS